MSCLLVRLTSFILWDIRKAEAEQYHVLLR